MFQKILIANRGEIACRIAATARRHGIRTVAVYSDADAQAAHVAACDEALRIGPATPRESYLQGDTIIAAAKTTGAQAIHPGYGFLSENEDFAQACLDAGLVFIGPPPAAIRAMGLKSESKRLMAQAGVPLVPGYHEPDQDPAVLQRAADAIGYPVLIKASAGGGGKGMRIVHTPADFPNALAACQREARNAFGDDAVLIERYLTRPRHIEVQVFGDAHGNLVHLFERDCSVQRRHQKVLEEAPAPGMTEARRQAMGDAAIAAAKAVGYVGAGTVEFIAEPTEDGDLRFYFMEMNTRLQVEHPVTEAITGLDLVEWQLRIAAGEPLPLEQHELRIHGHAIEARLCAENPDKQFLPATGTLQVFRTPPAAHFERAPVRLDAGVREGDAITPFYDSMLAKLVVWGETRAQALARLDAALAQTHIVGLHTNAAFLRRCAASRSFREADLDTALIERERDAVFNAPALPAEVAVPAYLAHLLAEEAQTQTADPWSRRDGWRLHGMARRAVEVECGGQTLQATLERSPGGALLHWGSATPVAFAARALGAGRHEIDLGERRFRASVYATDERVTVFVDGASATLQPLHALQPASAVTAAPGGLAAPMPGKVIAFLVQPGQPVKRGQALAVIEAMKMEHTLHAPHDGTVQALLFAAGDAVSEGSELLRVAAASG
jgi:3-methylcrotonyl-CoA carboxylase alpha subunit